MLVTLDHNALSEMTYLLATQLERLSAIYASQYNAVKAENKNY